MTRTSPRKKQQHHGGVKKGSKHLCLQSKQFLLGLYNAGMTYKDISSNYQVPRATLSRIIKKFKETKTVERKVGSGRPRKTSETDDHNLILAIKRDRSTTAVEVAKNCGIPGISPRLVRLRIAEQTQLKSCFKTSKPFINAKNRKRRVKWCMNRLHYTKEQWRRFLFSDESPFVLRFNKKLRVWCNSNERYLPWATTGTVKHDRKIMVWGCFSALGVGNLCMIEGRMDQYQYHSIIRNELIPSAQKLFQSSNWTFQQDNDPKHTARSTVRLFDELDIPVEEWPAQSPDLNPIENLWAHLNWTLRNRKCKNELELFDALKNGWNAIPNEYLVALADSMPERLNAVIDNKGYPTKY